MEKIFNIFRGIGRDKLAHFFSASLLLSVLLLLFNDAMAISVVLLTAAYKELINDKLLKRGNPEVLDFAYSALPCLLYIINTNF
tara:strand:+ start:8979 stop:9230 length:252 start_codon:yes stop_codon:yes gene_type:complete